MRLAAVIALWLGSVSTSLHAQSPFDGVWKLGPKSSHSSGTKFDISLQEGVFACRWCTPVWSIPADGTFHRVVGQPGYDEASIRIVDESTAVFTRKKAGRAFYQAVDITSKDEKYLAFSFTEIGDGGKVESGTGLWSRLTPKPEGARPVTGQWRELSVTARSNHDVNFTILTKGDVVRMEIAPGEILTAKFNGPTSTIVGDPRGTVASLRRNGETAFVQTDYRDGQIVSVTTSTLLNPTTMEIVVEYNASGSKSRYTARKQ